MTIVTVVDVGKYGVIKDHAPHTLPPEAWSSAINWRFKENSVHRMKGERIVFGTPSVDPLYIIPWVDGAQYWAYASGAAIYRTDGTSHNNITRSVGGAYNGGSYPHWTGGVFGGVLVLNNDSGSDVPQSWDGTANMEDMPGWPASTYCKSLRMFKQYMIAMNMTEGGTNYPTKLRWSVEADPGTVPTTWVAAATNNAGSYSLSDTTGEIVDGLRLGDMFVVYKTDSTHLMRLVGGSFVFHTKEGFRTLGILAVDCAVEFLQKHFVVGVGDVYVHDGTELESVIDQINRDYLFSNIDTKYKDEVRVEYHQQQSEIWIIYPTAGSGGVATEAAIWNIKTSVWSFRTVNGAVSMMRGSIVDTIGITYIISALTMPISSMTWAIGATAEQSNARQSLLMGIPGASKRIVQVDETDQFNSVSYEAILERTGLAISGQDRRKELTVDPTTVKYLREFYPRVTAPEGTALRFRFGAQMYFDEDIAWGSWQTFTVGTDRKLDVDLSFSYLAFQVKAADDKYVEFDGYDLDLEIIGRY